MRHGYYLTNVEYLIHVSSMIHYFYFSCLKYFLVYLAKVHTHA
jgi:hypothetical protein